MITRFLRAYGDHVAIMPDDLDLFYYVLQFEDTAIWRTDAHSEALGQFIPALFGQNVSEIRAKRGAKYSDEFFERLTTVNKKTKKFF